MAGRTEYSCNGDNGREWQETNWDQPPRNNYWNQSQKPGVLDAFGVNTVACFTSCTFSALTIGTALVAANTVNGVAMAALCLVALIFAAASMGAITAWCSEDSVNVSAYFEKFVSHTGFAAVGIFQLAVQAAIEAIIGGASDRIRSGIAGDRVQHVRVARF